MKQTIIVASGNAHKIAELQTLLRESIDVDLIPMTDVLGSIDIDETGTTFEENAYIKAQHVYARTGLAVIADDSGLIVDALDGEPGVYSARYAGFNATDATNRDKVSAELRARGTEESTARFTCVLCYMDQQRTMLIDGHVEGTIFARSSGSGGFGYDPMFVPAGYDETYGTLPQSVKDATSHRALAARKLATLIAGLYADSIAEDSTALSELDIVCRASIYAARGEFKSLRRLLTSWINSSERASVLYEALLQTYLFAGFPVALESLSVLHDVCTAHGYSQHAYRAEEYTPELYRQRGLELCSRVYGSVFEKLMQRFDDISPEMQSWMIVEGYGKTLSRPGLDEVSRECAIVCILAVLGRESQLYSHIRGAMNLGATEEHMATCAHALMECSDRTAEALFSEISQRITSER